MLVYIADMASEFEVSVSVGLVEDKKQEIETGQQGRR